MLVKASNFSFQSQNIGFLFVTFNLSTSESSIMDTNGQGSNPYSNLQLMELKWAHDRVKLIGFESVFNLYIWNLLKGSSAHYRW